MANDKKPKNHQLSREKQYENVLLTTPIQIDAT